MAKTQRNDQAFWWISFLLLTFTGIVMGTRTNSGGLVYIQIKPAFHSKPQKIERRSWKAISWQEDVNWSAPQNGMFHDPYAIRFDAGNLYVMDLGDATIKRLSPQGSLLTIFGEVSSHSSRKLGTLTDFAVSRDGSVWMCDPMNRVILTLNTLGQVIALRPSLASPYRIVIDNQNQIWLLSLDSHEAPFLLKKPGRQNAVRFGQIIEEQDKNRLALDGWIASDGSGGLIYAPAYAGFLLAFNAAGVQRFAVSTIEPRDYPPIVRTAEGAKWIDRRSMPVAFGMQSLGSEVYILTKSKTRTGMTHNAFDIYNIADGSYRYSVDAPEACNSFSITRDSLYTLSAAGVKKWAGQSSDKTSGE
jgi:hypothetical protein